MSRLVLSGLEPATSSFQVKHSYNSTTLLHTFSSGQVCFLLFFSLQDFALNSFHNLLNEYNKSSTFKTTTKLTHTHTHTQNHRLFKCVIYVTCQYFLTLRVTNSLSKQCSQNKNKPEKKHQFPDCSIFFRCRMISCVITSFNGFNTAMIVPSWLIICLERLIAIQSYSSIPNIK